MTMICGFVGFDFEGMMRVSYAEAAGNSVTFPSFNNASPLCAMTFKTSGVIQSTPAERICWKTADSPSTYFLFTEATRLGEASSRTVWWTRERASFLWSFVILAHLSPVTTKWRNSGRSWYSPLSNTANSISCPRLFTNFSRVFTRVYSSILAVPHSSFTQSWRTPFVRSDRLVVNLSDGQPRPALWRTGLITLRMNSSVFFEPN